VSFLIKPHLAFHRKRNYFCSSYYSPLEAITPASDSRLRQDVGHCESAPRCLV